MAKIEKDLEEAIFALALKEKHKLLIRLIGKDKILTEQLHFKLLENSEIDLLDRRKKAQEDILDEISLCFPKNSKILLASIRKSYAIANKHKKITADKLGEVEINIFILKSYFKHFINFLERQIQDFYSERLFVFLSKKIEMCLKLIANTHEDYHIEFANDMNFILNQAHNGHLKWYIKHLPSEMDI